jgi:uncharacterized protein with PIN domain
MKLDRRIFLGAAAATVGTGLVGPARVADGLPRLLVDHMLLRPGRYLRAAGYDAAIAPHGTPLNDLIEQGLDEDRIIVSSREKLEQVRAGQGRAVLIAGKNLPDIAAELTQALGVNWQHAPLSRCLDCNVAVEEVDAATWGHRVNIGDLAVAGMLPLTHCGACDSVYWGGGHALEMQARLASWSAGQFV